MLLELGMDFLVVGAGQLGSRHGQAIARLKGANSVTFIDPNLESLETAAERVREVSRDIEVVLLRRLDRPLGEIFLGIIATSSHERPDAVSTALKFSTPKHLLLEKLIASDYLGLQKISHETLKASIPTYVNCPMPFFDHYLALAKIQASQEPSAGDYEVS